MTTDIERQFFETFGIKTEERFYCKKGYCNQNPSVKENSLKCRECENGVYYIFPEITDRILLELICINAKSQDMYQDYYRIRSRNYNNLKIEILGDCMCEREDIKQQVQALFKEG